MKSSRYQAHLPSQRKCGLGSRRQLAMQLAWLCPEECYDKKLWYLIVVLGKYTPMARMAGRGLGQNGWPGVNPRICCVMQYCSVKHLNVIINGWSSNESLVQSDWAALLSAAVQILIGFTPSHPSERFAGVRPAIARILFFFIMNTRIICPF